MTSPSLTIREATLADLPALREIASESPTAPAWTLAVWRQVLESTQDSKGGRLVIVATLGASVAGFAILQKVATEGELENLAVAFRFRREKIATQLCQVLLASAAQAGLERAHLEVRESNAAALGLYAKLGFQVEGKRPQYYSHPSEDALLLTRRL